MVKKTTTKSKSKSTSSKIVNNSAAKKLKAISEKQTQAQIVSHLAEATELDKKKVKELFAATQELIHRHLKQRGSGVFEIPGLGIKVKRHEKPATKARSGTNPFTGEPMKIKAKPKRKVVKVQAQKKLKEIMETV